MTSEIRRVLIAAVVISAISLGVRAIFGTLVKPLSTDLEWPRSTFALSLALQNISWGLSQPGFGIIADKYGHRTALWLGLCCYVAGLLLSASVSSAFGQHLGAGVLVGMGIAGTSFGLILPGVSRIVPAEKRSQVLGMVTAMGACGQILFPPLAQFIVQIYGWRGTLSCFASILVLMAFFIPFFRLPTVHRPWCSDLRPIRQVLVQACCHRNYTLLTCGFFVCGFHVAFIAAHFPAYVNEICGTSQLGALALSVVGLTNVVGTILVGRMGALWSKPFLLSGIYAARALVILCFILVPPSPVSVLLFSMLTGLIWLSTIPLMTALIAGMFDPGRMSTLYGFVFLSHQLGSSAGVWVGGYVYDLFGTYDPVWYAGIFLGIVSAFVHLPIQEEKCG